MHRTMPFRTRSQLEDEIKRRGIQVRSFGAPATPEEIAAAERQLSQRLPDALRELYLAFNGVIHRLGSPFLLDLHGPHGLVHDNRVFRLEEAKPSWIQSAILFGCNGLGDYWAINPEKTSEILKWRPIDGEDYDVDGSAVLDVWEKMQLFGHHS